MKQTRILMGMPITIEIADRQPSRSIFDQVYDYFAAIDERFSPYKQTSEVSLINAGLPQTQWSPDMRQVMALCQQTREETHGYFDIEHDGHIDPSGLVKGWAINHAAELLAKLGCHNFSIEAGGDFQVSGRPSSLRPWRIGIRNPFALSEIIKIVSLTTEGIATSGTYIRGQHIYNPHNPTAHIIGVASLTVIAGNILEADRFATAAFAMGTKGIDFIESISGLEGYMINDQGIATMTTGFQRYELKEARV